jgi:hypothetical protein
MVHFFRSNFVLPKFRKIVIQKNVQCKAKFERTSFFDWNEFRKNEQLITLSRWILSNFYVITKSATMTVRLQGNAMEALQEGAEKKTLI